MRRYVGWKYFGFYWEPWRRITFLEALWVVGLVLMGNGIRYAIFWNPRHRYLYLLIALAGLLLFVPCSSYLRQNLWNDLDREERK